MAERINRGVIFVPRPFPIFLSRSQEKKAPEADCRMS